MSPFFSILVLGLSPALISALLPEDIEKAYRKCNTTNPVQRNPRYIVINGIVTGAGFILSEEERCHLLCFLQKVHFVDDDGDIRGMEVINFARKTYPVIKGHEDILYAQVFNIIRWIKEEKDKCQKAMIAYFRFSDYIFMWATTAGVQNYIRSKEITKSLIKGAEEGREIPKAVRNKISDFYDDSDANTKMKPASNLPLITDRTSNHTNVLEELFPGVYV